MVLLDDNIYSDEDEEIEEGEVLGENSIKNSKYDYALLDEIEEGEITIENFNFEVEHFCAKMSDFPTFRLAISINQSCK